MLCAGDTKAGVLVGTDKFGNKFYEDPEELPRTFSARTSYGEL